jgi:DNA-binding protein Fis|tara:strand:- start:1040 stop:1210 length:171 start_codon:yes stop_codon:yes gene_type:complete
MAVRVKVLMTINIDESEYPMPVDERVDEEVEDALREYFHDIDGMSIKNIKTIMENV